MTECLECGSALVHPPVGRKKKFCGVPCAEKWARGNGCRTKERRLASVGKCSVEGCSHPKQAKGLCRGHHKRMTVTGVRPTEMKYIVVHTACKAEGCQETDAKGGYCMYHYHSLYVKDNRERYTSHARRRQSLEAALPWWKNHKDEIEGIYAEASRMSLETGIPHEVDHVIPIRHKLVCGLHVPWNLRIITLEENRRKHNKFVPG